MKVLRTQCVIGLLSLILFFGGQESLGQSTEAEEKDANKVESSIYMMSIDEFNKVQSQYIMLIVDEATSYCSSSPEDCGLDSWEKARHGNFSEDNFEMMDGYPKYKKPYLNVSYALHFPDDMEIPTEDPPTKYYLNKDALETISGEIREDFYDETGYSIIAVGHQKYNLPPNNDINVIIIPIAILVVVACIITMGVLRCACKHAHKPEPVDTEPDNVKVVEVATGENSHEAPANSDQKTAI